MTKTLKFAPDLAQLILDGKKTSTWRLFDDKDLQTGDLVTFIRRPELTPFSEAKLTVVYTKPLGQLTEVDKEGHEDVGSDEQMYRTYKKYYSRKVDKETEVKIIRFKIIKIL